MAWVRLDDTMHDHPKFLDASLAAVGLWTLTRTWAARHRTDLVPASLVAQRAGARGKKLADELVARGLWITDAAGWRIHDAPQYDKKDSRTPDEIAAARSEAGRKGAAARWQTDGKPHTGPDGKPMASDAPVPSRPVPSSSSHLPLPPPPSSVLSESEEEVVSAIKELRPEWAARSIRRALADPTVRERSADVVRAAALAVARDPESKAPGRLKHDGPWWTASKPQLSVVPKFCRTCTGTHLVGDDPCPDCTKGMTA